MKINRTVVKRMAVLVSLAAATAFAGIAQADDGGMAAMGGCQCAKGHHRHFGKVIARKLGLTDAQKAQAKAIFQNNTTGKRLMGSLMAERKNMATLMHADTVDEAAIRAESAKIGGIQADLSVNRARLFSQFKGILTPDQLAKLKALKQKHHGRGCEGAGNMP